MAGIDLETPIQNVHPTKTGLVIVLSSPDSAMRFLRGGADLLGAPVELNASSELRAHYTLRITRTPNVWLHKTDESLLQGIQNTYDAAVEGFFYDREKQWAALTIFSRPVLEEILKDGLRSEGAFTPADRIKIRSKRDIRSCAAVHQMLEPCPQET